MRALATQNNIEGETRLEMSFWDKVHIFPPLCLLREKASLFWNKMAGLFTTLIMQNYMFIPHTKQLYISRVRFLDLPQKPSSKNLPLSECLSVETREWTAQAKAEVAYQLGNVNVQSIDPLLQLAASPEEMWKIVAEI